MTSKHVKLIAGLFVAGMALILTFSVGLAVGIALPNFGASIGEGEMPLLEIGTPSVSQRTDLPPTVPESTEELFLPFWEAWDIVHEQYVDQPVDDLLLMRGAIRGMVDSLGDPHTSFMDPDEFLQANMPLEGEYEGIGAWVDADGEFLTIISAMPGSPAERAGLQPGDQVISVDGVDVTGLDGNVVIRMVLGPAGSAVELTIRREGEVDPLVVEIVRERIDLPSVASEMLDGGIGYVRLYTFGTDTAVDLNDALKALEREDARGVILDLRGNGGGFLDAAIAVTSQFIDEGTILIERFGDGREQIHEARSGGAAIEMPMVVLIDGGTASASEIVAGAIQDHDRGVLVGERSFGKGSVQNWVELSNNQGAVRVTIARWYTPGDRLIHEIGLTPDFEVPPPEDGAPPGSDPQLDRAIQVLLSTEAPE